MGKRKSARPVSDVALIGTGLANQKVSIDLASALPFSTPLLGAHVANNALRSNTYRLRLEHRRPQEWTDYIMESRHGDQTAQDH